MDLSAVAMVAIRWAHALAAVAWVGGAIYDLLVLRPALETEAMAPWRRRLSDVVSEESRALVEISAIVLIVTGVLIGLERLSRGPVTTPYVVLLGVKIALAAGMFLLALATGPVRRRALSRGAVVADPAEGGGWRALLAPSRLILYLGALVFLLTIVLRAVHEMSLRA